MSNKLRGIKRIKTSKDPMVLAIVDGGNEFSPDSCAFVPKSVAEANGFIYVEGNSKEEYWVNMMKMCYGKDWIKHAKF